MSDKDRKGKPSLVSSLRRSLARPGGPATTTDEIRPMLPTVPGQQARPSLTNKQTTTPHRPGGLTRSSVENFEISLRDRSDATAKRGFRVQVPKRMLSYAVLVFVVCPLALFVYMEMHKAATSHAGHHHAKEADHHHFHHDVLSLLTEDEETNVATETENRTASIPLMDDEGAVVMGNATTITDAEKINENSTQLEQEVVDSEALDALNATDTQDAIKASNETISIVQPSVIGDGEVDNQNRKHRALRKPAR